MIDKGGLVFWQGYKSSGRTKLSRLSFLSLQRILPNMFKTLALVALLLVALSTAAPAGQQISDQVGVVDLEESTNSLLYPVLIARCKRLSVSNPRVCIARHRSEFE